MTKKEIVALADALRIQNQTADGRSEFTPDHLLVLADFCASQHANFNRKRWIDYIDGVGGPGEESMFVEPGCTVIPAAIAGVNRSAYSPKGGRAVLDKIESLKPGLRKDENPSRPE